MKLLIAIVQDDDASKLISELMEHGIGVTKLATTGGFLRSGNTTLIIGVEDERQAEALDVIERVCKCRRHYTSATPAVTGTAGAFPSFPVEVTVGGATVFVLNVEQMVKV